MGGCAYGTPSQAAEVLPDGYDMRCPSMGMQGDNYWQKKCLQRQRSGCFCKVADEIRVKNGFEPRAGAKKAAKKEVPRCACGNKSRAPHILAQAGLTVPTCGACIKKSREERINKRRRDRRLQDLQQAEAKLKQQMASLHDELDALAGGE